MNAGASFDTSGTPGGVSILEKNVFQSKRPPKWAVKRVDLCKARYKLIDLNLNTYEIRVKLKYEVIKLVNLVNTKCTKNSHTLDCVECHHHYLYHTFQQKTPSCWLLLVTLKSVIYVCIILFFVWCPHLHSVHPTYTKYSLVYSLHCGWFLFYWIRGKDSNKKVVGL